MLPLQTNRLQGLPGRITRQLLLLQLGDCAGAREAFNRAIALAGSPAEAAHIRLHLDRLSTLPALPPASAIK